MVQRNKNVELLAPAGSFESLKGAVHAGADAVYMGGTLFSARAYADNPDNEGLKRSVDYCHFYGRRLYLAVNTLLKQDEIDRLLYDYMAESFEAGIDGVIVQDLGVMRFIHRHFPTLPIHLSTQASVMTAEGAEYLRKQIPSVTRVVPARELSLEELKRFRNGTGLEIEVFVHGALCVCYSGMCLMSSYIGDRSGNRGRCAQPCRREYTGLIGEAGHLVGNNKNANGSGSYLLSPKDQCLLKDIPELIGIGVDSFKIEGRMKSPEYTAGTVAVYRRRIDEACGKSSEVFIYKSDILAELYNRGGFNRGYLHTRNGQEMMSMLRPNHSGVEIGRVEKVNGREALIKLSAEIFDHDVLEIRRGEKSIFEFTTAQEYPAGSTISTLTMKDRRAAAGDRVYRTRCGRLLTDIRERYIESVPVYPLKLEFTAHEGQDTVLTLSCDLFCSKRKELSSGINISDKELELYPDPLYVSVKAAPSTKALKAPITAESIKKQLCRFGDTAFEAASFKATTDDDIFIPVSQLNDMRREACAKLEKEVLERTQPIRLEKPEDSDAGELFSPDKSGDQRGTCLNTEPGNKTDSSDKNGRKPCDWLTVSCVNIFQLKAALDAGVREICYNINSFDQEEIEEAVRAIQKHGDADLSGQDGIRPAELIIGLPYACRYDVADGLKSFIGSLSEKYSNLRFMVRNFDELALLYDSFPEITAGHRFETDHMPYCLNSQAQIKDAYRITLSNEADLDELRTLVQQNPVPLTSLIIYGYQPSMVSAQCVYKNIYGKCQKGSKNREDIRLGSQGHTFRTMQQCGFCTNIIYNSECLNNIDLINDLAGLGIDSFRIDLTFESADEAAGIIRTATGRIQAGSRETKDVHRNGYTRGHLYRPVL